MPSHSPSRLQEFAPSSGHSSSGSVADFTAAQTPSVPPVLLAAQAWHAPEHGASQHTPSTQLPDAHCELELHAAPGA